MSQILYYMDCVTIYIAIFLSSASGVKQDAKDVCLPKFRKTYVCNAYSSQLAKS